VTKPKPDRSTFVVPVSHCPANLISKVPFKLFFFEAAAEAAEDANELSKDKKLRKNVRKINFQ
jgi:hypothetical protein